MDYNIHTLQMAGTELAHNINKTTESFRNEQKVHKIWDKKTMEGSMEHWERRRQGFDKKLAQTVAYVEETEKITAGIDKDKSLSGEGAYDAKRQTHEALHTLVSEEAGKEIKHIDEEILRIQNTTKLQSCTTGSISADEIRFSEIRNHYRDKTSAERNLDYILAGQTGNVWTMQALAESPVPGMVSEEALAKGKKFRLRREKPAESYAVENYQHLKKHYQLIKTRISDTLMKLGFVPGDIDNSAVIQNKSKHLIALTHQQRVRSKEGRSAKYGRQV